MRTSLGFLGVILLAGSMLLAQDRSPGKATQAPAAGGSGAVSPENTADAKAIGELTEGFTKAYNGKDAQALGGFFTQNAEIQDEDGAITRGRDAIVTRFARQFAEGGSGTLKVSTDSLRFPAKDLAIEEGTATLTTGAGEQPRSNRYTVTYAREGGRWLHAMIRDEPAEDDMPHERLSELEWMLGEWINESDDAIVLTTCKWSEDGNFLLRDFKVESEGRIDLGGTQRIGWDAQKNQFRTWVFDSKGGFAEGLMVRDDDRWVVKSSGVRPDGTPVSVTSTITVLGKDRMRWELSERTLGEAPVPGTDAFDLVRRAPSPASKPLGKDAAPRP
jgi:uncharacterized protein (TIGR02246 family)